MKKIIGNINLPITIRTVKIFYMLLILAITMFYIPQLMSYIRKEQLTAESSFFITAFIIIFGAMLFIMMFVKFYYQVNLDYEKIKYKPLAGKGFELYYREIKTIDIKIIQDIQSGIPNSQTFLVFNANDCIQGKDFKINLGLLSKSQWYAIIKSILSCCPDVKVNKTVNDIAQGDFSNFNKLMLKADIPICIILLVILLFKAARVFGRMYI